MSSQAAVTNNAVLVWEDMKALERASNAALEKGDVSTSLRNVLAILTLLNGVSMTRETESADRQTSKVQLLRQVQEWIEDKTLTAAQIAERILEATGRDILGSFGTLSGALDYEPFDATHLLGLGFDELKALVATATAKGTGIELPALDPDSGEAEALRVFMTSTWFEFLEENSLNTRDSEGNKLDLGYNGYYESRERLVKSMVLSDLRTDPEAQALAKAYAAAAPGAEAEAAFDALADHILSLHPDDSRFPHDFAGTDLHEALLEGPALLAAWDAHLAQQVESHGYSGMDAYMIGALDQMMTAPHHHQSLSWNSTIVPAAWETAQAHAIADFFQAAGIGDGSFDLSDPSDVAAAAGHLAGPAFNVEQESESVQANLDQILIGAIGVDFSGFKDGLASGREELADRIQSQIDVDTRLSDNQALSLKEMLQQQQVLLTLISELVNKQTYLNRLVLTQ